MAQRTSCQITEKSTGYPPGRLQAVTISRRMMKLPWDQPTRPQAGRRPGAERLPMRAETRHFRAHLKKTHLRVNGSGFQQAGSILTPPCDHTLTTRHDLIPTS